MVSLIQGYSHVSSRRTTIRIFYVSARSRSLCLLLTLPAAIRLVIGLFGLVGMFGVAMAPFVGRIVDKLVPWYATLTGCFCLLIFQCIQTGAGGINIAAVVIVCFGIDVFRQMQQVSLTSAVFGLEVRARARLNAILIISVSFPMPLEDTAF